MIGQQPIYNEAIASVQIRYAKLVFGYHKRNVYGLEPRCLKIPIPFMKRDHGIIVRISLW